MSFRDGATRALFAAETLLAVALATACFSDTRFAIPKYALSAKPMQLAFMYTVNPDCTVKGIPTVRLLKGPEHGQLGIAEGSDYTHFSQRSQYFPCNRQKTSGVVVSYTSSPGYTGTDSAKLESITPDGGYYTYEYAITVK